jgi:hypothetical protein
MIWCNTRLELWIGKNTMSTQPRNNGKFQQKSEHPRRVRSIRVTDPIWEEFTQRAFNRGFTTGDFFELLTLDLIKQNDYTSKKISPVELELITSTLKESLNLKGNATSKIKAEVIKVLEMLDNL